MGNELASCAGKSRATKGSKHRKSALRAGEWYNYVVASLTKGCLIVSLKLPPNMGLNQHLRQNQKLWDLKYVSPLFDARNFCQIVFSVIFRCIDAYDMAGSSIYTFLIDVILERYLTLKKDS